MKNQINYRLLVFSITISISLIFNGCSNKEANKSEALSGQGKLKDSEFTVCHKSNKPSGKIFATKVSDLKAPSWDIQLTLICLQGLVNRESPSLFIVQDTLDEKWLDWIVERGDVTDVEWISAEQIIDKFASVAEGIVTVDTLIPATFNTGTMLGGIKNYLVATPSVIAKYALSGKISKHTPEDLLDLRQFHWKTDLEAYQWFYDKYYDQLTHKMCAMTDPYDLPLRDYMVEFKVPLFWVKADQSREELDFVQNLLMKLPSNIPCLGWPFADRSPDKGMGEHMGVHMLSEFAKFELCSGWESVSRAVSNLSLHSGTTGTIQNSTQPIPQLENKVYITFIRTDGDGANFYLDRFRRLWDDTTTHGKFAMGWQLGPMLSDLMPDILDWYVKHATPNDYFVNALTGIGYIHENLYGTMYPLDKQKEIWKAYLDLSRLYRERLNLSMLTTFMDMSTERIADFAGIGFKGIFYNYGRTYNTSRNNQLREINGVPVFHAIGASGTSDGLAKDIRLWAPRTRPAFVYVSLSNWVTSLKPIDEALKQLGPEYVTINPEQMVGLYWKSKQK
jgi:hypothetical protein